MDGWQSFSTMLSNAHTSVLTLSSPTRLQASRALNVLASFEAERGRRTGSEEAALADGCVRASQLVVGVGPSAQPSAHAAAARLHVAIVRRFILRLLRKQDKAETEQTSQSFEAVEVLSSLLLL
eukprot:210620-Chlamydomonas_euryale.AAC.1